MTDDPLILAPDRWEDLPLPKSLRYSLKTAVELLPFSLSNAVDIDDEVVAFTQKGGWENTNTYLLLRYRLDNRPVPRALNWKKLFV